MNTGVNGNNGQSHSADLHVQEVIRSAERELHELLERRADLMKRIGTIKQTLAGLANIFGDCVLSDELLTFLIANRPAGSRVSPAPAGWSSWKRRSHSAPGWCAWHCSKDFPRCWSATRTPSPR